MTWSAINEILQITKRKRKLPDIFKCDKNACSGKQNIANQFNNFFTDIGKNLLEKSLPQTTKNYMD